MSDRKLGVENSKKFVELFNALDQHLRSKSNSESATRCNFIQILREAKHKNAVVRTYYDELEVFSNIRNVIVHNNDYLVFPNPSFLDRVEVITNRVCNPPNALDYFRKNIECFNPDDKLHKALEYMRDNDFSQIVIWDKKVRLLTSEGLNMWLLANAANDLISLSDTLVGDVLKHEPANTCDFASRDESVFDLREKFGESSNQQEARLFAIIITEHGKDIERPLGIATPWDMFTIVQ